MKRIPLYLLLALAGGVLVGCQSTPEQADATEPTQVERAQEDFQASLDRIDSRLVVLEDRLAEAGSDLRSEWYQSIAALREERKALSTELGEWKESSAAELEKAQDEMDQRLAELNEKIDEARLFTIEQRDEFTTAAETQISAIDARMTTLQARLDEAGDEAREEYAEAIADLKATRHQIAENWERLEASSEDTFEDLRTELADAVARLDRKVDQVTDDIERGLDGQPGS